jgi:hypothetical protein
MKVLSHILIVFSLLISVSGYTQRINPATQIQKSPGNAPGYILRSNSSGELSYVLNTAPGTGTVAPSGPPPAGSSGIYQNTTTGQVYTWNGTTWNLLGSGSGTTNLVYTSAASTGTVNSDTGTDALIPAATTTIAGLMTGADKTALQDVQTALATGGQSDNGIAGSGLSGDKYRLGGALTQNTTISGADFGFTLNNAGTILLESDNTTGPVKSELALTSSNIIGTYLRSVNESNPSNVSQLSLDIDGTHGLQWTTTTGQPLGFLINPNTTTATSGITVATRKHALGTALAGQVLTRQADGTVEYQSVSGGGGITTYSAGSGTIVTATGTGVTFTRTTASVWTFDIPTGIELLSFDINSTASQSATAALDIDFVFAGTRPYNQDVSVDMTDAKVPVLTTLKKINPSTYPTTAAGNNAAWTTDVTAAGTLRISTTEFGEVSSSGANATSIKGVF